MAFDQLRVELCSVWGGDRDVANAAWASTFSKTTVDTKKTDDDVMRVVTGVVHNHHDTPKERLWMEFFFTMPIFCERQYDKYRMTVQYQQFLVEWFEAPMGRDHITQNELSGRYRTIPDRPYHLPADVIEIIDREKSTYFDTDDRRMSSKYEAELQRQHDVYQNMLESLRSRESLGFITNDEYKRAREVLRGLLGTAYLTDMRVVMNANAFEHIINQRLDAHAQTESRVLAYKMVEALKARPEAKALVSTMINANGWGDWMSQIEDALSCDASAND